VGLGPIANGGYNPKLITDSEAEAPPTSCSGGWMETWLFFNDHHLAPPVTFDDASLGAMNVMAGLNTLVLSGDFSGGFSLTSLPADIEQLGVGRGHDYVVASGDDLVGAGESLLVEAVLLGAANHILFDGRAETDGRFVFSGGGSNDTFYGGAGNDVLRGLGGGDALSGGGGADIFRYLTAGDSTGPDYDRLADFSPAVDFIDLPVAIAGFAAAVATGTLSAASFNADLGAAARNLAAGQAFWFAPNAGDLAGQIFLVADGNGQAGYQAGEDYVFAIGGSSLADLTPHSGFFI
ncbi:MAG TPA: hypothetical protein VLK25_13745, partial [Allosphingosinicella sp.]|nr:hypothetical protein [Allosphingosinicella sp.]